MASVGLGVAAYGFSPAPGAFDIFGAAAHAQSSQAVANVAQPAGFADMTETAWGTLRRRLVERYDDLRILLTRRLGSDELARETLHETWLRLDRIDDIAVMMRPLTALMRDTPLAHWQPGRRCGISLPPIVILTN